jgi:RNA polymerase sigma-70 factor (ECF subfamily)
MTGRKGRSEFEHFFLAHYDAVARSVGFVCGDHEVASDATQEAFLRAYKHWSKVRKYDNPVSWVRRIAINVTRDEHRSAQRRERRERLNGGQPRDVAPPDTHGSQALESLMALPDRQRAVAALFYLDDLSTAEIAEILDIAEGTVRFHLSQARTRLRESVGVDPEADRAG